MQQTWMMRRVAYVFCVMGLALGTLGACTGFETTAPTLGSSPVSNEISLSSGISTSHMISASNEISITIEAMPVDESASVHIHRIRLPASNAYVLEGEDVLVLVDAGLPFSDRIIVPFLEEFEDKPLRLIYITHAHIDHYGGAAKVREKTGAPIAIHAADAAAMAEGKTPLGSIRDWTWTDPMLPLVERWAQAPLSPTDPDILLEDGDNLAEWGLPNATVVHTPGHTPGSSTLLVDEKYAFVGDLISTAGTPRAQSSYADHWPEVAASLRRVQQMHPQVVYPGHGPPLQDDAVLQSLRVQYVPDPVETDEPDEATE